MRIAIVIQRYGLDIVGGAEYHAREVAEHLNKYFPVEVLTTCAKDYRSWSNEFKEGSEFINGVMIRRFKNNKERPIGLHRDIEEKVFYKSHNKDDEIKWIDAQGPYCPDLIEYIKLNKNDFDCFIFFAFRYYTSYYGIRAACEKSFLAPLAEDDPALALETTKNMFEIVRGIIYNAPEERELILKNTGYMENIWDIVGCGVRIPDLDSVPLINENYILYLGRIEGSKGCYKLFEYYLQAEKELDYIPNLILAGFKAIDIPTHNKIKYLGFVSEEEKLKLLKNAKFLINPSPFESLSLVALEALACETPILVNGECDVLKGHCIRSNAGLWYNNFDEFIECLKILSINEKLREKLGVNGRRYVELNYGWDCVEKKYLDLLMKFIQNQKVANE